jgi:hypothetical protein
MDKRVLIVHPSSDMILTIQDLVDEIRSRGYCLSRKRAKTAMEAEQSFSATEPVDLVITAVEIPEGTKASAGAGEQCRRGLELVRRFRALSPGVATILVVAGVDDDLFAFTQSEGRCALVVEGKGFEENLRNEIIQYVRPHKPDARVNLDITLSERGYSYYQFQPEGQLPGKPHLLTLTSSKLTELVDKSRGIDIDNPAWMEELRLLGENLSNELFESTPGNVRFYEELTKWKTKVGFDHIRVRFAVEDSLHPIAVEALRRHEDLESWMLRTAVYRGHEPCDYGPIELSRLFEDEETRNGPINFLIIEADVEENAVVEDGDLHLKESFCPLPNVKKEVKAIKGLLSKLREPAPRIGEVRVIRKNDVPVGGSFEGLVNDVLSKGPWHVVHYTGHTLLRKKADQTHDGYLIFPGKRKRTAKLVRIDVFASFLRNADTRLVFLCSCDSAQLDFIFHLAKQRVPAIMGFLWKVNDDRAVDYVESFYTHLFEKRSLEYACLEAKKDLNNRYPDDPIWASSVLVIEAGG